MKQDKLAEIGFFDEVGNKGGYDVITEAGYIRILEELQHNSKLSPAAAVVDLGCGTGSFTDRLAGLFPNITGIDISQKCISYASGRYPNLRFETGDLEALRYENESVDLVSMFGVLHHFPQIGDALKEPMRILKKGGLLFSYDPNINNPFFWVYHSEKSPFYSARTITSNEKLFAVHDLKAAVLDAGFEIVSLKALSGVTLESRHRKYSGRAKPFVLLYNAAERLLDFSLYNRLFGSSIICVARKKEVS